mmetsp:Transcript_87853/g.226470  ORF Transcript_87853/g.226470 Transcript_87853/m.226470 type:complete len:236 (-) Transcript_87853:60-767(-)
MRKWASRRSVAECSGRVVSPLRRGADLPTDAGRAGDHEGRERERGADERDARRQRLFVLADDLKVAVEVEHIGGVASAPVALERHREAGPHDTAAVLAHADVVEGALRKLAKDTGVLDRVRVQGRAAGGRRAMQEDILEGLALALWSVDLGASGAVQTPCAFVRGSSATEAQALVIGDSAAVDTCTTAIQGQSTISVAALHAPRRPAALGANCRLRLRSSPRPDGRLRCDGHFLS